MRCLAAAAALFVSCASLAQPTAIVLVAKPGLADPDFRHTVVLVTHTPRGETVGVVLNRPTRERLAEVAPKFANAQSYREPLYRGGPVLPSVIVALFRSPSPPDEAAFEVLPGAYLTLHPGIIEDLLERPDGDFRLFAGFCGWAPGQLEREIARDSWYVFPARENVLFRDDPSQLWQELVEKARALRARVGGIYLGA